MIIEMPQQLSRTKQEITEELRLLHVLLNKLPRMSFLGEDNYKAIHAQIRVLNLEMTTEQVADMYEDGDRHTLDSALNASEWLRDDGLSLFDEWMDIYAA